MCNIFYETYNKSMKNWLFFPQGHVQMIFILLTKWKIQHGWWPLSYLLPLMSIITVFPKRNGLLCLSSQIISCGGQRGWCTSKLGSTDFPFKCLIFLLCASFQSAPCETGQNKTWGLVNVRVMAVVGHFRTQGRCKESFVVKDGNCSVL